MSSPLWTIVPIVMAGVLGLIFGSFATVVAYRVPRREDIVHGRSRCPSCGKDISAIENIPVISYLVLRARCPNCKARISIRYPLIEAGTGALFALAVWKFGPTLEAAAYAAFFWVLIVLTAIDVDHKLLPNRVVYPSFVIGWILLAALAVSRDDAPRLVDAAMGAAIFGGFFLVIAFLVPAGMGGGDVKLAFVLGTFVGYLDSPGLVLVAMFLSFVIGGIVGAVLMWATGGDRKMQVPFGPFLAAGTVLAILSGQRMLDLYLGRL